MLIDTHIAALTKATADYESAWRAEIGLPLGSDERKVTSAKMQDTYREQATALAALTDLVGADTAAAIHAGLIIACASTHGERPKTLRDFPTTDHIERFIHLVRIGQAGVTAEWRS